MKMKAILLVFLCLFAIVALSVILCATPSFSSRELPERIDFNRSIVLFGDPYDTPGGGG